MLEKIIQRGRRWGNTAGVPDYTHPAPGAPRRAWSWMGV